MTRLFVVKDIRKIQVHTMYCDICNNIMSGGNFQKHNSDIYVLYECKCGREILVKWSWIYAKDASNG